MNGYKKFIKDKNFRYWLIHLFDFIPDKTMVQIQYFIKTHRKLNLKNPKRWTEKSQWYKLYYHNPLMTKCVDKYGVREYVESKGYGNILNDLYWVGDDISTVEWDKLPDKFVVKLTSGSGTNVIVKDKSTLDINDLKKKTKQWLRDSKKKPLGREWPYYNVDSKIIIEKYIEENESGLTDYKFFCFNGKISHSLVISDRYSDEKVDLYDEDFNRINVIQYTCPNQSKSDLPKPENYELMKKIVIDLSKDFPHVRVDLYNINGQIIFGELTFFSASGYNIFDPDSFDFEIGERFILPEKMI